MRSTFGAVVGFAITAGVDVAAVRLAATGSNLRGQVGAGGAATCMTVSRAPSGSCVVATACEAQDTSNLEYSFFCANGKDVVKHTFGVGADADFAPTESYDTDIACDVCSLTLDAAVAESKQAKDVVVAHSLMAANKNKKQTFGKPVEAAFYGPSACVSTFRSTTGTCVMQTRCKGVDMSDFDTGLTCVDGKGKAVRHLFGKNSFDAEEVFDTMIECQLCLGVSPKPVKAQPTPATNATATAPAPAATIQKLVEAEVTKQNKKLAEEVKTLTAEVSGVKDKLAKMAPAPAPAPAALVHTESEQHVEAADVDDSSDDGEDE